MTAKRVRGYRCAPAIPFFNDMNAVNIKTVGGCVTRLTVNVTAPEGVTTALTGFVRVQGVPQPAQVIEPGVLLLPAAEPGEYLYEVRAGGRVAAFGHLLVRQSAYPATGDTIDAQIDADLTQSGGIFAVTLTEGARGKQGEKGEKGNDGADGRDGATPEEVAAVLLAGEYLPQTHRTTDDAGGNAGFTLARFPAPETGRLCELAITCRSGGSICTRPLYLVLTTADGQKYVSTAAVTQSSGARDVWSFAAAHITRGEMLTLEASYTPDGDTTDDAWVGCLGVSTATAAAGQCQGTNGGWFNILLVAELGMQVAARPVLLTAAQQEKLNRLLAD